MIVGQTSVATSLPNERAQSAKYAQHKRDRGADQYQNKSNTSTGQARAMIDHNEHTALHRPLKSSSVFEQQKP